MVNPALQVLMLQWYRDHHQRQIRRRFWVHDIFKRRKEHGEYHRLVQELQLDHNLFHHAVLQNVQGAISESPCLCGGGYFKNEYPSEGMLKCQRTLGHNHKVRVNL